MPTATELPVDTSASAEDMANEIFGNGVTVNSATYSGDDRSSGIYTNGDAVAGDVVPGDSGVILSTGLATDFTNSDLSTNTNQTDSRTTDTAGIDGDSQFNTLAGGNQTFDAAILEVNFTPEGDTMTIDFVISSEEYPEYINSQFLDVVGVWVNGVQAQVSIGDGTASVGNVNGAQTPNLYNDNTGDAFNTEMDGFTITLTFVAPVNPGVPNILRIGIADVSDATYDSNLLIAGGSVQSTIVAQDDSVTMGHNDTRTLDVLDNDSSTGGTLTVTHINGTPVVAGQIVTLGTGQQITLNADGTFNIVGDSDAETVYFNYSVVDTAGNTDTAIVEVEQVPCFAASTLIETPEGAIAVEDLRAGDMVTTRDSGPQMIRWIGQRTVSATGPHCPIRISAGQFGATHDLLLSPQHRVMIAHYWADLLFGQDEVLVKAKDLINDRSIRPCTGLSTVTYVHFLFDSHHIVTANGVSCESYLPGPNTVQHFDAETQAEILGLFPELDVDLYSYGPAARTMLKSREAMALCHAIAA